MRAQNWAFAGAATGVLMLAGLMAEGQVDKIPRKRAEKFPRDAPGAAPARPIGGEAPMRKVLATDIGTRVQIVGRLGYPLGELVTIQGSWIRPRGLPNAPVKDDTPYFTVMSVNGRKLDAPVSFDAYLVSEAWGAAEMPEQEGPVWEVRGCETGGFRGTPGAVSEDALKGSDRTQMIPQAPRASEFKFYTGFIYSSCKRLK